MNERRMNDPSNDREPTFPGPELTNLWNRQETPMSQATLPHELTRLTSTIKDDHRSKQLRLAWINVREIVPIALFAAFFIYLGVVDDPGLFVSAALCAGIGVFMVRSSLKQRRVEQQFDTSSVRETIERSLSQARFHHWMYRYVGIWYCGPLGVALAILYIGTIRDDPNGAKLGDIFAAAWFIAVLVILWLWGRRIANNRWRPEVERFETLLADVEDS